MSEQHGGPGAGRVEAHRIDSFVDAAFAFAVSVMAIAGAEVPHSLHDLLLALDRTPGFACSFATLMIFWHRQVRWRERFRLHDAGTTVLSLMLVFFALIFVYPLNMLFQALFSSFYDAYANAPLPNEPMIGNAHDLKALYVCFALAYMCMAGCLGLLYGHSLRRSPPLLLIDQIKSRRTYYVQWGSVAVAILSLLATWIMPERGSWTWMPGAVYLCQIVVNRTFVRWSRKRLAESP
ncbi:DUF1211 domain-containing protein [Dyella jejuensis]|uniref:DUF1211 domain-containing protein n=1 Tax=Dyella jejuensis TaxID=1432009 RepID=A0ABW8JNV4_9GAMM